MRAIIQQKAARFVGAARGERAVTGGHALINGLDRVTFVLARLAGSRSRIAEGARFIVPTSRALENGVSCVPAHVKPIEEPDNGHDHRRVMGPAKFVPERLSDLRLSNPDGRFCGHQDLLSRLLLLFGAASARVMRGFGMIRPRPRGGGPAALRWQMPPRLSKNNPMKRTTPRTRTTP